jgi:geranylgeranyl diphosphate synthase type I
VAALSDGRWLSVGLDDLRQRVERILEITLDRQAEALIAVSPSLEEVVRELRQFLLQGGKRLRPAFCYWGWRGAGHPDCDEILTAAAALELLHGCALIHDDLMDGSECRRGRPAMHRRFAALHAARGWSGASDSFGAASAILLGDLSLCWCDQMLDECGLPPAAIRAGKSCLHLMQTELVAGQYLEMREQALGVCSSHRSRRVIRYKSAKYTVERPLHLGGALAGAPAALLAAYTGFGLPVGEAFQLRDELLGVFGDPALTGKSASDDLREGKPTLLIAHTVERATGAQQKRIRRLHGNPALDEEGAEELRHIIRATGALAAIESLIDCRMRQGLAALSGAPITPEARQALTDLAIAVAHRDR